MDTQLASHDADELSPYRLVFQSVQILVPNGSYLIGRERRSCDIILPQESISRVHCVLTATNDSLEVRDLQSQNGVFVNGSQTHKTQLEAADEVRLGNIGFTIAVEPVKFVDVRDTKLRSTLNDRIRDDDMPQAPPSSVAIPIGDLSRDSVEIPADILAQSLLEQIDESVDEFPVESAAHGSVTQPLDATTLSDERERPKREPPARLTRQALPDTEQPALDRSQTTFDSSRITLPVRQMLATTTGKLAIALLIGWGIYLVVHLLQDDRRRDREIADRLDAFGDIIRDLRSADAPAQEWAEFRHEVDAELPDMLTYLEANASSEEPSRQLLLRAARDCLPRMIGMSRQPSWYEERFHEYLREAQEELDENS